jgi:hypothetical protein
LSSPRGVSIRAGVWVRIRAGRVGRRVFLSVGGRSVSSWLLPGQSTNWNGGHSTLYIGMWLPYNLFSSNLTLIKDVDAEKLKKNAFSPVKYKLFYFFKTTAEKNSKLLINFLTSRKNTVFLFKT